MQRKELIIMKKHISYLLTVILLLLAVLSFASCGPDKMTLNDYYSAFTETTNGTLSVKFSLTAEGTTVVSESIANIDSNKVKMEVKVSAAGQSQTTETYLEQDGSDTYVYVYANGKWTKSKITDENYDSAIETAEELEELFNEEYYSYDESTKKFSMNPGAAIDVDGIGTFSNVLIEQTDTEYKLTANVETNGMLGSFEMLLNDIGNASVTLPEVS